MTTADEDCADAAVELALDDVLECPLDGGGVERAVADTLDDLVVLTGDTGQLLDGGHDDPLPCRRLLRCDLQRRSRLSIENGVLHARFVYKTPFSLGSAKLLRFDYYYSTNLKNSNRLV